MQKLRRIISKSLTWTILLILAIYLYKNAHLFAELKHINISDILIISGLQIFFIYTMSITNFLIIKQLGTIVKENFQLQIANNFINKLVPKGGAVFRSVYLKSKYKLEYSKFISSLMGTYIITFISSSIFALCLLGYMYLNFGFKNQTIIIILLGILFSTITLTQLNIQTKGKNKISKIVNNILTGWNLIKKNTVLLIYLTFIAILGMLVEAASLYIILQGIGENVQIYQALFLAVLSFLTMIISITPSNIGLREGAFVIFASSLKIDMDTIIFASLIHRIVAMIAPIILGPPIYLKLSKELKNINSLADIKKLQPK